MDIAPILSYLDSLLSPQLAAGFYLGGLCVLAILLLAMPAILGGRSSR